MFFSELSTPGRRFRKRRRDNPIVAVEWKIESEEGAQEAARKNNTAIVYHICQGTSVLENVIRKYVEFEIIDYLCLHMNWSLDFLSML